MSFKPQTGISNAEIGYKYAITLLLIKINEARGTINERESFTENASSIGLYEGAVNGLDNFITPYKTPKYENSLKEAIESINKKTEPEENDTWLLKKKKATITALKHSDVKYKLLLELLKEKNMLLDEGVTERI